MSQCWLYSESPGFTTTRWAEYNLGLHKLLWGLRQIHIFIMTNAQDYKVFP